MAKISQIRGLLLEEVILYLLEFSGYRTILKAEHDETLHLGPSGIEVKGRGCDHQIDAIADFVVATPFSNPQRLLVEAKCYVDSTPIGVECIRNALGVLMDVSEYWIPKQGSDYKRYHYQYAVFSASGFSVPAEKYAFAHDIYLFPLNRSSFFRPILKNIRSLKPSAFGSDDSNTIVISLKDFRSSFRELLRENIAAFANNVNRELLIVLADTCHRLKGLVLGMVSRHIPIILTPNPELDLNSIESNYDVEMHGAYKNSRGWVLTYNNQELFSFDIPMQIFQMYSDSGALKPNRALGMKAEFFSEIQAIVIKDGVPKVITFRLDRQWLEQLMSQGENVN